MKHVLIREHLRIAARDLNLPDIPFDDYVEVILKTLIQLKNPRLLNLSKEYNAQMKNWTFEEMKKLLISLGIETFERIKPSENHICIVVDNAMGLRERSTAPQNEPIQSRFELVKVKGIENSLGGDPGVNCLVRPIMRFEFGTDHFSSHNAYYAPNPIYKLKYPMVVKDTYRSIVSAK